MNRNVAKPRCGTIHPHVASFTAQCLPSGVPVVCLAAKPAPIYRPRQPRQSPLYKTIERYLPEIERTYDRRYAKQYGPWRPIIGEVARPFLRCGDLHFGFARIRCPDCRAARLSAQQAERVASVQRGRSTSKTLGEFRYGNIKPVRQLR